MHLNHFLLNHTHYTALTKIQASKQVKSTWAEVCDIKWSQKIKYMHQIWCIHESKITKWSSRKKNPWENVIGKEKVSPLKLSSMTCTSIIMFISGNRGKSREMLQHFFKILNKWSYHLSLFPITTFKSNLSYMHLNRNFSFIVKHLSHLFCQPIQLSTSSHFLFPFFFSFYKNSIHWSIFTISIVFPPNKNHW